VREFHSNVGGRQQDGLWGIAELTKDRFVVVGGSAVALPGAPNGGAGTGGIQPSFPFTDPFYDWGAEDRYCIGAVLLFDASPIRLGVGPLELELSYPLGRPGDKPLQSGGSYPRLTHVRDVCVTLARNAAGPAAIMLVGATNDVEFNPLTTQLSDLFGVLGSSPVSGYGPPPGSATVKDGFLLKMRDIIDWPVSGAGIVSPYQVMATFQGAADGGYCGVAAWSEHASHVYVAGRGADISVTSFDADSLVPIRGDVILSVAVEEVAAMGIAHCTDSDAGVLNPKLEYYQGPPGVHNPNQGLGALGSPAGGGLAVDPRGRLNVAGSTSSVGYPVVSDSLFPASPARPYFSQPGQPNESNGIRTMLDMLPYRVGRSDGTGEQIHNGVWIPAPLAGWTGGTTPTCALLPFGRRVGEVLPAGTVPLDRMLVDWDGSAPQASSSYAIVIDAPPPGWQLLGTVIQWGVPTLPPPPSPGQSALTFGGIENWVTNGVSHSFVVGTNRVTFALPPALPGGVTYSAQVVAFLAAPLVPVAPASCPVPVGPFAATPAIVFSYQ